MTISALFVLSEEAALLSKEEISKLSIKELRKRFSERGQSCSGCAEKSEWVNKYFEIQSQEVITPKPKPEEPKSKKKEMDDIMASLKKSGLGGGFQAFSREDLDGLSPEEMARKFEPNGGRGRRGGSKKPSSSSKDSGSSKIPKDSDNIEL